VTVALKGLFPAKALSYNWKVVAEKAHRMYDVWVVFDSPQSDIID
jgi:hypothetical protein